MIHAIEMQVGASQVFFVVSRFGQTIQRHSKLVELTTVMAIYQLEVLTKPHL